MALGALFLRDVRLAWGVGGGGPVGIIFFLSVTAVAPFALGPDLPLLSRLGPALLWIAVLLALLLGLERVFQVDQEDGTLDQLRLSNVPLELIVLVKAAAHWTVAAVPLMAATPFAALLLNIDPATVLVLLLSFLVGTPALAAIGAVGAAVAVSLRRSGVLIAILVLPLSVPVLIFGVAMVEAYGAGRPIGPPLALACAISLIALAIAPFAAAAALREVD